MSGSLLPITKPQYTSDNANALAGGKVFTYQAGTTTPKTTYTSYDLSSANPNPVILDSAGRASIWGEGAYKVVVKDANDVTLWTTDDVRLSGTVATVEGGFSVDHTAGAQPYPVKFTHSNSFTNLDTYGSGTVLIEATAQNCNQPLLVTRKAVDTSSLGNAANLILWNTGGPTVTTSSSFAVDFELVCNNSTINTYNGKWELGVISGNSSATRSGGGLFYIASRRGPQHPSGENTGFERYVNFYALTQGGEIESTGNGISFTPAYDFSEDSYIDMTNSYQNTIWTNEAALTGKYARIENVGRANGSYIRTQSTGGTADIYCQANDSNSGSTVTIRSNWVTPGTGSSILNLYTDSGAGTPTGFRIQSSGTNGRFNIKHIDAGVQVETLDISPADDGLMILYQHSDVTKGRIKLGSGGGAATGGLISYDSNTGIYSLTGTNAYVTTGSGGYIQPTRLTTSAPSAGSTVSPTVAESDYIVTTGSLATLTVNLPATPPNGHKITFMSTGGVTALTTTASGGATVLGAPTTLAANGFFTMIYRTATTTWYRNG